MRQRDEAPRRAGDFGPIIVFETLLESLASEFPGVPAGRIRAVLLSEVDAMTGGVPLVVPLAAAEGAREVLGRR